jgi:hemoglobin-like flavoprotein
MLRTDYAAMVCDGAFNTERTMTPRQIQLVQDSWERLQTSPSETVQLFYARLFELNPELRALFRNDMQEQQRKFTQMLSLVVDGLEQPEQLAPMLYELGRRHLDPYRVQPQHYDSLGAALLWTLSQRLGVEFTTEMRQAWSETYRGMAHAMQEGEWWRQ